MSFVSVSVWQPEHDVRNRLAAKSGGDSFTDSGFAAAVADGEGAAGGLLGFWAMDAVEAAAKMPQHNPTQGSRDDLRLDGGWYMICGGLVAGFGCIFLS